MIKNKTASVLAISTVYVFITGLICFNFLRNNDHINYYLMAVAGACFLGSAVLIFFTFAKRS